MVTDGFKFAPDDLGGGPGGVAQATGGGAAAAVAPQAAAASSPGDGSAAAAAQAAAAASVPAGSAGSGGQAAAQAAQSFRDMASQHGFDLRQYGDDAAAMGAVVNFMRQAQQQQQLAQYGQQYLQHAAPFQQYLTQMQQLQAQRQQQAQQQSWWKAPEFDPSWRQLLTRDAQGNIVALPGAPPDLPQKYLAALQHQQQFLDKFAFDPLGAIKPGVEEVARAVAQQLIQQHLGGYQEQQFANSWVQQNSAWLYARDGAGNPMIDQSGRPVLSDYGRKFAGYVQEAQQMGIKDVGQQQKYALQNVQFEYMVSQYSQRAAGAPQQNQAAQGDAAKQQFLQQAAQRPANGAGTYGAQAAANQPGPKNQRELASVMSAALAASGFGPGAVIS